MIRPIFSTKYWVLNFRNKNNQQVEKGKPRPIKTFSQSILNWKEVALYVLTEGDNWEVLCWQFSYFVWTSFNLCLVQCNKVLCLWIVEKSVRANGFSRFDKFSKIYFSPGCQPAFQRTHVRRKLKLSYYTHVEVQERADHTEVKFKRVFSRDHCLLATDMNLYATFQTCSPISKYSRPKRVHQRGSMPGHASWIKIVKLFFSFLEKRETRIEKKSILIPFSRFVNSTMSLFFC